MKGELHSVKASLKAAEKGLRAHPADPVPERDAFPTRRQPEPELERGSGKKRKPKSGMKK